MSRPESQGPSNFCIKGKSFQSNFYTPSTRVNSCQISRVVSGQDINNEIPHPNRDNDFMSNTTKPNTSNGGFSFSHRKESFPRSRIVNNGYKGYTKCKQRMNIERANTKYVNYKKMSKTASNSFQVPVMDKNFNVKASQYENFEGNYFTENKVKLSNLFNDDTEDRQISRNQSINNLEQTKELTRMSSSKNFHNKTFYNTNNTKKDNCFQNKTLSKFYQQKISQENIMANQGNDSLNSSIQGGQAAMNNFYDEKNQKKNYRSRQMLAHKLNEMEGNQTSARATSWLNLHSQNPKSKMEFSVNAEPSKSFQKNEDIDVSDTQFGNLTFKESLKSIQTNNLTNYKAKTVYVKNDPYKSDKGNYRRIKVSENDWSNLLFGKNNKVNANKKMIRDFEDQLRVKNDQLNRLKECEKYLHVFENPLELNVGSNHLASKGTEL